MHWLHCPPAHLRIPGAHSRDAKLNFPAAAGSTSQSAPTAEQIVKLSEQYKPSTSSQSTSSQYHGVCHQRLKGRWVAQVRHCYVGAFDTPEEAARAYDVAAYHLLGP